MRDHINVGDEVHVDFNCAQYTLFQRAKVLHVPQATGDSWIFEGMDANREGQIAYVSEGCTILKLKPKTGEF